MKRVAQAIVLAPLLCGASAVAQETLEGLRARAYQGDPDAQRNLASCLGEDASECPTQPEPNAIEACAWRMIIVASGHAKVSDADVDAYQTDCGFQTLSRLEQLGALALAERLFVEIYKRDMPMVPLLR